MFDIDKRILDINNAICKNIDILRINEKLVSLGWTVLHFWGQDISKHLDTCIKTIEETILDLQKDTFPDKSYLLKSKEDSSAAI